MAWKDEDEETKIAARSMCYALIAVAVAVFTTIRACNKDDGIIDVTDLPENNTVNVNMDTDTKNTDEYVKYSNYHVISKQDSVNIEKQLAKKAAQRTRDATEKQKLLKHMRDSAFYNTFVKSW